MIRPRSKARQKQMREYLKLRAAYLQIHPWCEVHSKALTDRYPSQSRAIDIHHVRGRVGSLLLETKHWKAVCRACHFWIQNNPILARQFGLIAPLGQWNQTEKLRQQKERNAGA